MDRGTQSSGWPLVTFFTLTFAVAWTCFYASASVELAPVRWLVFMTGVFAPSLVALALTAQAERAEGVLALLRRLVQWKVGVRWYLFAVGYMAAIKLTAAILHRIAMGAWPRFGDEPWFVMLAATAFSTFSGGQAGEEIGWRGYALPRLAARFGFAPASLVLGVIWASWHIPLFFISGIDTTGQSFPLYLLQVTALSVALTWLFVRTNGSLLLTMLMHAAVNNTKDIVPSAVPGAANPFALSTSVVAWLTVIMLWIFAGYFLVRMSRGPRTEPLPGVFFGA